MLKIIVLVTSLNGIGIFTKINVPKDIIVSFIETKYNYDCICAIPLRKELNYKNANIYNRTILLTKESCDNLRQRFYK